MSNLDSQTLMERMNSGYSSDYIVKVYEHIPNGSNFLKDKRQYTGTFQSMMDYVMGLMHRVSDIPSHAIVFNQDTGEEHQINSDGSYIILKKQFNEGGEVEDGENKEMLENQVINILHHAEELKKVLPNVKEVEAWVITKIQRSVTDLADVTHYLEGETKDKYAEGGEVGEYNAMYFKQSVTRDGSKIDTMRERMVFSGSIESVLNKALPNFNPLDSYVLINDRKTGSVVAKMTPDGKAKLYDKNAKVIDEIEVEQEVEKKEDEPKKKLFGLFAEGGELGVGKNRIYFSSFAEVMEAIYDIAEDNGYEVKEIFPDLSYGGVGYGQTKRAKVELEWNGKEKRGKSKKRETNTLNVQIYRMDSGNYELNTYFSYEDGGKMAEGGIASENANDKFYKWYVDWLKGVNEYVNVSISIPNEFSSPIKDGKGKIVILDVIEKKGDTDAKKYMNEILEKADEFGVSIYLQPIPRTHNLESQEHKDKITKDYLIKYYQKFGFKNMDGGFMVREPKMADGGYMAKGGKIYKIQVKDKYDIQPKWEDDTWHTGGKKYLSFKDAQVAVKKLQGDTAYAHQEFKVVEDKDKMAEGGEVKFKDKVKAIKKSLLERKKVSPSVQKDYGKTYSPKEAEESAKRIVGAMTAKERLMAKNKKTKK